MMKRQVFRLGDHFTVTNDLGEDVATVDATVWSVAKKLSIKDVLGRELASIQERLVSWGPTYELYRDGYLSAIVKKEQFKLFPTFTVDVPGPDDLTVEGDYSAHEYVFVRADKAVAAVSKAWFQVADTYGVELLASEDAVLILAATVVIDLVNHDRS